MSPSGYLAHALGWPGYYVLCVVMMAPGLLMLLRYDRWGQDVGTVVHHPSWLENKADLVRHGFVGLSHRAGRPVTRPNVLRPWRGV